MPPGGNAEPAGLASAGFGASTLLFWAAGVAANGLGVAVVGTICPCGVSALVAGEKRFADGCGGLPKPNDPPEDVEACAVEAGGGPAGVVDGWLNNIPLLLLVAGVAAPSADVEDGVALRLPNKPAPPVLLALVVALLFPNNPAPLEAVLAGVALGAV